MEESDPDAIVIPPEDGQPGMTRRELLALHELQKYDMEMRSRDMDEIIFPPSEDNNWMGITRAELQTLHERQKYEMHRYDDMMLDSG